MRWPVLVLLAAVTCLPLLPVSAEDAKPDMNQTVIYRNARMYTGEGPPVEKGVLVVRGGKIVSVGTNEEELPAGGKVIDLSGKTIIPGLVDTHSHVGIYPKPHVPAHSDGNEGSGAVQSGLRALDAIWPDDPGVRM